MFEEVINAACSAFDIVAYRADDISDPGEIPEQIFEALRDEELVIADLTGANPNVMYELGIRHVSGGCTIPIGEKGRLPFDINTIRTVQFRRTPSGLIGARKALEKVIGKSLANGWKPSTAARVIGTADKLDDAEGRGVGADDTQDTGSLEPGNVPDETPGFLDALVDLETGLPEMTERMTQMTELTERIGTVTSEHGEKLKKQQKASQGLALIRAYSAELEPLAREYDEHAIELHNRLGSLSLSVDAVVGYSPAQIQEESDEAQTEGLLQSLVKMGEGAFNARTEGLAGYLTALQGIEHMSRDLRPVVQLLERALERTMLDFETVEAWGQEAAIKLAA